MPTAAQANRYLEIYQRRRVELLKLIQEQATVVKELGLQPANNQELDPTTVLAGLIERLQSDQLRALVVGRFNAGKSTFINALFGQVVLPVAPVPTTGVLCQIAYATQEEKRAVLFSKPGMGENGPRTIKTEQIKEELTKYVQIDHKGDGQSDATSRYSKCEIYWPLELCRLGVQLTDSVGLDDPASRDAITLDFAQAADVIVYCMKAQDVYSAKDQQVLTTLRSLGHQALLFIITNYDSICEAAAEGQTPVEEFKRIQQNNLLKWTEIGADGIQYVDSRTALKGRTQSIPALIDESGIVVVEEALGAFLAGEKGRAKLMASLRPLRAINLDIARKAPLQIQLWQTSTAELERRYRDAEAPLRLLEAERDAMVALFESSLKDAVRNGRRLADLFFSELPDKVAAAAEQYEIQAGLGFPPRKSTIEPAVAEVVDFLRTTITQQVGTWNESTLSKRLEEDLKGIQGALEGRAREFLNNVDSVRVQIAVGGEIDKDDMAERTQPSMASRLIGLGFALVTGDIVTGAIGAIVGPRALLNTLAFQITGGVILAIFSMLNPVALIVTVIASILAGNMVTIFQLRRSIARKVGSEMAGMLRAKQDTMAADVEQKVRVELDKLREALAAGLQNEIDGVRIGVETVLDEKKTGEASAESKIAEIRRSETRNHNLSERIFSLLEEAQKA